MEVQLHWVDWAIFASMAAVVVLIAIRTQRYMKSVSDFLAAGRTARRFLLTIAGGAAGHAAVRVIGTFEMAYQAGFTIMWWPLMMPVNTFIHVTGFVVYRFRETRALTLAQFLEIRYSKKLRIFTGILMFVSGVINMGIFPAVAARFFMYFCRLPETIYIGGVGISTLIPLTFILVGIAVYLTLGGQITLLFTEFFEGITTNFAFLVILAFLFWAFPWHTITESLMTAPPGQSMLNPYHTSRTPEFGVWYFILNAAMGIYSTMAWQGNQGFNSAPATPHEARMGKMWGQWREVSFALMIVLMPVAAYVMMHNPAFSAPAEAVHRELAQIPNEKVQTQMIVPIALAQMLPMGLKGIMCAIMFCGFVGNLDTYLHSWGSIFVQDVLLPFRKTPFSPATHIKLLRWAIVGVALFISLFSLVYEPAEFVVMFQIATGAIYLAGAGAIIIGGLYWSRGTSAGAWTAMLTGAIVMLASITLRQIQARTGVELIKQPNFQFVSAMAMVISCASYVLVSLLTCREPFNLQRMLHRGAYADAKSPRVKARKSFLQRFGINHDFTLADKLLCLGNVSWATSWSALAIGVTIYSSGHVISDQAWSRLWEIKALLATSIGLIVTFWVAWGGIRDLKYMIHMLRTMKRDDRDDGMVVAHRNLDEVAPGTDAAAESQQLKEKEQPSVLS